jgi:sugar phosphate isomerase/epimerase
MKLSHLFFALLICTVSTSLSANSNPNRKVGISIGVQHLDLKKAQQLKNAGIDCIETNLTALIRRDSLQFKFSDEETIAKLTAAKKAADEAGLEIWSIHMPFGKNTDLSLIDESRRKNVIEFQKKALEFLAILKPKIILFHPSYYLGLGERRERTMQLILSANELNKAVKKIGATMVIENMLGPELLVVPNGNQERPLLRTVKEAKAIFKKLPKDVYAAVDLNHIKKPEEILRALGKRVKTIHVADGDGNEERHYFPCDNRGQNDWKTILNTLNSIGYKGPFMYESNSEDVTRYKKCYDSLKAL